MTDFLVLLAILTTTVAAVVWSDRHIPRNFLASLFPEGDETRRLWSDDTEAHRQRLRTEAWGGDGE